MFSKLRPHHKRTSSNPASPAEQSQPFELPSHADHAHPSRYHEGNQPGQPLNPPPPPPFQHVARVNSAEGSFEGPKSRGYDRDPRGQQGNGRDAQGKDTNGYGNHQRLPYAGLQGQDSTGNAARPSYANPQSTFQGGVNHETLRSRPTETSPSFSISPDTQKQTAHNRRRPPYTPAATVLEPTQARSGRTRLNLLNPMSLLARRRTSQAVPQLAPESLVTKSGNSYSGIRGTVVHDFSAPRAPRRNVSYNDVREEEGFASNPNLKYQKSPNVNLNSADDGATSPWSNGNHTPVFTENFEEEQYPHAGPHVRKASDLQDLSLPQPPYARGAQISLEPSSKFHSSESEQRTHDTRDSTTKPASAFAVSPDRPPPVPPKSDSRQSVESRRISIDTSATPPKSAPSRRGRPRNVSEVSMKDAALPKHMKSTSSRFSFDMIGAAKQEKLLEERHRQKALEKKAENDEDEEHGAGDAFEDDYDYDNMDDDDGLEERIPGVNTDLEEEEYPYDDIEEPIPGVNAELDEEEENLAHLGSDDRNLGGFRFQQSTLATPLTPMSPGMVSTPRDADGQVIGFAMTKNSPYVNQGIVATAPLFSDPDAKLQDQLYQHPNQGLGLQNIQLESTVDRSVSSGLNAAVNGSDRPKPTYDDDLYFDDGLISGVADGGDEAEFDESVFDNVDTDQYGRPLQSLSSRTTLPTLYSPPMLTADPSPSFRKSLDTSGDHGDPISAIPPTTVPQTGSLVAQPSISGHGHDLTQGLMGPPPTQTLTQDTLAAYQSALAAAAFTAAANGKFRRDSINPSEQEDTQPGLINDSGQTSHYEPFSPSYDQLEDDFDYDDELEDDPIIAAANAEALANDCDGFYGQEFGFYSAPATTDAQLGGYFGPRGGEGIARGLSNRIVSREPNLTPITERSEYSNRNSFMSLSLGMHGPSSAISPGLAQLTSMLRSPDFDNADMSFDALLKLRRGAWGGSQASLHSSNGSPKSAAGMDDGSPVGAFPPWAQGGAVTLPLNSLNQQHPGHRRKNSTFSLHSEGVSAASSPPASPTLTMAFSPLDGIEEKERDEGDDSTQKEREGKEAFKKHRYTTSAESISYTKEEDPVQGGKRWVLERRRTGESGEVELEREVVVGGI